MILTIISPYSDLFAPLPHFRPPSLACNQTRRNRSFYIRPPDYWDIEEPFPDRYLSPFLTEATPPILNPLSHSKGKGTKSTGPIDFNDSGTHLLRINPLQILNLHMNFTSLFTLLFLFIFVIFCFN
jgi:hypothetical protein